MGIHVEGKVFKSGNSAAVRLPKELGYEPGTRIVIERRGNELHIKPIEDPEAARRKNGEMVERLRAIWAEAGGPPVPQVRDPDIFPDRPGLY